MVSVYKNIDPKLDIFKMWNVVSFKSGINKKGIKIQNKLGLHRVPMAR